MIMDMLILTGPRNTWLIRHSKQITPATTVGGGFYGLKKSPPFFTQTSFEEFFISEEDTQTHF
jgi:hypothetical protein